MKKKRTYRRKRAMPKTGFFKVIRWSSNQTTNTHLNIVGNDALYSGTAATFFKLADVNGFSELVSLFDNFRIVRILYRWVCNRNPDFATGATTKGIYPRLNWTHDFNDSAPISRDLIYQRANMREAYFTDSYQKTRWYTLKPATLVQMYESGTSTAYTPKWSQWMDTNDSQAPHYGIKYAFDNCFTGISVQLEAKIVIECKGIS